MVIKVNDRNVNRCLENLDASINKTNYPMGGRGKGVWRGFKSQSMHYTAVRSDGVVGSKWTHMGGYVDHHLAQWRGSVRR